MNKQLKIVFALLLSVFAFTSCSESDGEEYEYADWQNRNDTYFNDIYNKAKNGGSGWKIIRNWSLEPAAATQPSQHIVVEVLEDGTGTECPMYTDSVYIHYSGSLIPSKSYPAGYNFDRSYTGEFNPATAKPIKGTPSGFVSGFTTALLNMRAGDRWRVYIPYSLAYGTTDNSSIPGYSTLVFDIYLVASYRPDEPMPEWRAKQH